MRAVPTENMDRIAWIYSQTVNVMPTLGAVVYMSSCLNYKEMDMFGSNMKKEEDIKMDTSQGRWVQEVAKEEKDLSIFYFINNQN